VKETKDADEGNILGKRKITLGPRFFVEVSAWKLLGITSVSYHFLLKADDI
jgi:hypothetical protein